MRPGVCYTAVGRPNWAPPRAWWSNRPPSVSLMSCDRVLLRLSCCVASPALWLLSATLIKVAKQAPPRALGLNRPPPPALRLPCYVHRFPSCAHVQLLPHQLVQARRDNSYSPRLAPPPLLFISLRDHTWEPEAPIDDPSELNSPVDFSGLQGTGLCAGELFAAYAACAAVAFLFNL